jgi:hypothetical protein
VTFLVTYWICRGLSRTRLRPAQINAGVRLSRTADGGYETVSLEPPAGDGERAPAATGSHGSHGE